MRVAAPLSKALPLVTRAGLHGPPGVPQLGALPATAVQHGQTECEVGRWRRQVRFRVRCLHRCLPASSPPPPPARAGDGWQLRRRGRPLPKPGQACVGIEPLGCPWGPPVPLPVPPPTRHLLGGASMCYKPRGGRQSKWAMRLFQKLGESNGNMQKGGREKYVCEGKIVGLGSRGAGAAGTGSRGATPAPRPPCGRAWCGIGGALCLAVLGSLGRRGIWGSAGRGGSAHAGPQDAAGRGHSATRRARARPVRTGRGGVGPVTLPPPGRGAAAQSSR